MEHAAVEPARDLPGDEPRRRDERPDQQRERRAAGKAEAEKGDRRNAGNPVGASGQPLPIGRGEEGDLRDAQARQRQIVALETQHRERHDGGKRHG